MTDEEAADQDGEHAVAGGGQDDTLEVVGEQPQVDSPEGSADSLEEKGEDGEEEEELY